MNFEFVLLAALIADLLFGDPRWIPHPVRGIGKIAQISEKFFRSVIALEKPAGAITFFTTLLISVGFVAFLLEIASWYSPLLHSLLAAIILYFFIAIKDLTAHSREVYLALVEDKPLSEARRAVGRIVGRDTTDMNESDISRACVETVAENMVDGITAPIFWAVLFSLLALFLPTEPITLAALGITAYKTINTMDSMFGYKNNRYLQFGWTAARVDDLVNYIPARLSGVCIVIGAFILRKDARNSLKVFLRDRLNHASPNAAHTEAALAGALGLRLGGPAQYFGEMVDKPIIGDQVNMISPAHIPQTNILVVVSSGIFISIILLLRKGFILLF